MNVMLADTVTHSIRAGLSLAPSAAPTYLPTRKGAYSMTHDTPYRYIHTHLTDATYPHPTNPQQLQSSTPTYSNILSSRYIVSILTYPHQPSFVLCILSYLPPSLLPRSGDTLHPSTGPTRSPTTPPPTMTPTHPTVAPSFRPSTSPTRKPTSIPSTLPSPLPTTAKPTAGG